jgi:hypothetical protein
MSHHRLTVVSIFEMELTAPTTAMTATATHNSE